MKIEQLLSQETAAAGRGGDLLSEQLRFWRRSIEKHQWAIAILTVLVGAITAFVVNSMTPIYRATATLFIEPTKSTNSP